MIHLYFGNGKGKTTAACGLVLRAAGSGMRVLFLSFFKNGQSSENKLLASLPGVTVALPPLWYGRYKTMTGAQRSAIAQSYRAFLHEQLAAAGAFDLIVLDEVVSAYNHGVIDREELLAFLREEGARREIVLTGRDPAPALLELADYATEMRKEKHPFDRGVPARRGVEF